MEFNNKEQLQESQAGPTFSSERPLQIEGLDYANYVEGQVVSRVKKDRLEVRPRKFGIFRIKSVNEVYLKRLRLEMFTQGARVIKDGPEEDSSMSKMLIDSLQGLTQLRNVGRIQRVLMDGLELLTVNAEPKKLERVV